MQAIDLVSKTFPTLRVSDTILKAQERMNDIHVSHLPILGDSELLGLLSLEDIPDQPDLEAAIGSLSLKHVLGFVYDQQHFYDVIKIMDEQKLSLLPVIDQKRTYLGSISQEDVITKFAQVTSSAQPGGVIVLEMNERDLSILEVLKIVESNNARALSLFTESIQDSTQVLLTLKLNRTDLSALIATFERFKYQIKYSFQNDNFRDDTLDRYESFMNYLKM